MHIIFHRLIYKRTLSFGQIICNANLIVFSSHSLLSHNTNVSEQNTGTFLLQTRKMNLPLGKGLGWTELKKEWTIDDI